MSKEKWLEVSKVSRRLTVSSATVYRLVEKKILHGTRFGVSGCLRISEKSVNEFEQHRANSTYEA